MIIESFETKDTYELGRKLGKEAKPGQVLCLYGDLGVGENGIYAGICQRSGNRRTNQQSYLYHRTNI